MRPRPLPGTPRDTPGTPRDAENCKFRVGLGRRFEQESGPLCQTNEIHSRIAEAWWQNCAATYAPPCPPHRPLSLPATPSPLPPFPFSPTTLPVRQSLRPLLPPFSFRVFDVFPKRVLSKRFHSSFEEVLENIQNQINHLHPPLIYMAI